MSYEKAMKHSRNVKKLKKQRNMYMGFDVSSGSKIKENRELVCRLMDVKRWFRERHDGNKQFNRECIRETIAEIREIEANK